MWPEVWFLATMLKPLKLLKRFLFSFCFSCFNGLLQIFQKHPTYLWVFKKFLNLSDNSGLLVDGEYLINIQTTFIEYSSILINGGIINNLVLFLIFTIIFSKWRHTINYWNSLYLLSQIIVIYLIIIILFNIIN